MTGQGQSFGLGDMPAQPDRHDEPDARVHSTLYPHTNNPEAEVMSDDTTRTAEQTIAEIRALVKRMGGRVHAAASLEVYLDHDEVWRAQIILDCHDDAATLRAFIAELEPGSRDVSWFPKRDHDLAAKYHIGGTIRGLAVFMPANEDIVVPVLGPEALAAKAAKVKAEIAPREVAV